jgi:endogenous inhibitor of DNA gyrase (YacG/DUF329 family)
VVDPPPTEPPAGGSPPPAQRHFQAPCPNCGAPVEFRSISSASAICSFCRSTVVRDGETLRKIGQSAELFDDHSPLQLGASGRYRNRNFTLIGRQQHAYGPGIENPGPPAKIEGSWNEWHMLFADGASAWLSEDNDQFVVSFDLPSTVAPPPADSLAPGRNLTIAGAQWQITSRVLARVLAAEGELPLPPALDRAAWIVELRNPQNQVATLDYGDPAKPQLAIGQPVRLEDLVMSGLKGSSAGPDSAAKTVQGRSFNCPSCGAPVSAQLQSTRSISCDQCHAVIDLSQGVGAELKAWQQAQRVPPTLTLGRTALLAIAGEPARVWQVVGYQVKRGTPTDDQPFTWKEYLLFNQKEGFAFLVESEEGWVGYRTLTGAPRNTGIGTMEMTWNNVVFARSDQYPAQVVYVEGEFYWQVDKDQWSKIADYRGRAAQARDRLSREETDTEVLWSLGKLIPANQVANAFRLTAQEQIGMRRDVRPFSNSSALTKLTVVIVILIVLAVLFSGPSMGPYSSGPYYAGGSHGGSWGGSSSAGGHK